jgi:hypothetical protein
VRQIRDILRPQALRPTVNARHDQIMRAARNGARARWCNRPERRGYLGAWQNHDSDAPVPQETVAEAIAKIDALCPWLQGVTP